MSDKPDIQPQLTPESVTRDRRQIAAQLTSMATGILATDVDPYLARPFIRAALEMLG